MNTPLRWKAAVHYRTENGPVDVTHEVSELEDLHDLIERGPHWDTVIYIHITRINHNTDKALTIEAAAKM